MATTTDTLIFEFDVDDGKAVAAFNAWDKRIKELEKTFEKSFSNIGKTFGDAFKSVDMDFDVPDINAKVKSSLSGIGGTIKGSLSRIGSLLTSALVNPFLGAFKMIASAAGKAFGLMKDAIVGAVKTATDFVKDSISVYMSFEDQLALVGKTTGMAGNELKDFGKEIIELAKPIGNLTAEDLLKVAEAAGQLGIAKDDIAEFSKSIGIGTIALDKFGGSTEKLATSVAKQMNVFGDAASKTDNYLSMLSKLSTSTAANELQISNFNLGMAKTASAMGITAEKSSALGAVLIAGGLDASSASRLLSSSLVDLSTKTKSVGAAAAIMEQDLMRGGEGFKQLEEITGRSRESFASTAEMIKTAFGMDAVGSLLAVSEAFNGIPQSAEKTGLAYNAVGKTGLAVLSLLGEAASKPITDLSSMEAILRLSNDAFLAGNEHLSAYDRQMDTTSAKIKVFGSVMDSIKLIIGEVFVAAIGRLMEKVNLFINDIATWVSESEAFNQALADVVAFLEQIADFTLDMLMEQFKILIDIVENEGGNAWDVLAEKVAMFANDAKTWIEDTLIPGIQNFIEKIREVDFSAMVTSIQSAATAIGPILTGLGTVVTVAVAVKDAIAAAGTAIGTFAEKSGLVNKLEQAFGGVMKIAEGLVDIFSGQFIEGLKRIGDGVEDFIKIPFEAVTNIIKTAFEKGVGYALGALKKILSYVTGPLTSAMNKLLSLWNKVKSVAGKSNDKIKKSVEETTEATKDLADGIDKVTEAQEKAEDVGVTNSTWPALTDGIKKTEMAASSLAKSINKISDIQKSVERSTVSSIKNISGAYANLAKNIPTRLPQMTQNIADNYESQPVQKTGTLDRKTSSSPSSFFDSLPESGGLSSVSRVSRTTQTTTKQTVVNNISFVGQNVIDESSKNRFARQITTTQKGLSSLSVRA